jgi:hypothetical protein
MRRDGLTTAIAVAVLGAVGWAQEASQKVDIVRVTGCLRHTAPDAWILSAATDPITVSRPAQPVEPASATLGSNEFKLIGIDEFDLPSRKDRLVTVKGLLIKATPVSRLNITSVTTVAETCGAAKK